MNNHCYKENRSQKIFGPFLEFRQFVEFIVDRIFVVALNVHKQQKKLKIAGKFTKTLYIYVIFNEFLTCKRILKKLSSNNVYIYIYICMLDNKETNNKKHQNLTNTMKKVLSKFTQIMKKNSYEKVSALFSPPFYFDRLLRAS